MLAFFRASNYHRTVDTLLTVCVSPGDKRNLVPSHARQASVPQFGTGKGKVKILDSQWDRAIETEAELRAFLRGRR